MSYDTEGRKVGMHDPDMGTWSYGYDPAGNVLTQTDSLNQTLYFAYDQMNRVTAKYYGAAHYPSTPDVKYYYDNAFGDASTAHSWGRLRDVEVTVQGQGSNANGHGYLYDPRGLPVADVITTTAGARTYTVGYSYDVGGRLTTLTYPDPEATHEQVSVSYNSQQMGLPAALSSSLAGTWPALSSTYNERAQLTSLTQAACGACGDLLTTNLSYDDATTQRGWLTGEQVGAGSSTLLDLQTRYFPNGDVSSVSQDASGTNSPVFTNTFTYDTMDRLAGATSTLYPNETYSFDTLGRMSTRFIGGTPYAYTYGDAAHVDAPTAYQGNSYGYDAAGQQTSGPVGGRNETRTFDPEHRLAQVTTTGNASATIGFVYDGTGKRLLQTVTSRGTTTTTLYIGNLYEEQVDADAGEHATYTSYYYLGSPAASGCGGLTRGTRARTGCTGWWATTWAA